MLFAALWCELVFFMLRDNTWKIPCGRLSLHSTSYLATQTLSKTAYTTQIDLRYVLISIVHVWKRMRCSQLTVRLG